MSLKLISQQRLFSNTFAKLLGQMRGRSDRVKQERLVIIGTGWAGFKLMQKVNKEHYEVSVVSPRYHSIVLLAKRVLEITLRSRLCLLLPVSGLWSCDLQ